MKVDFEQAGREMYDLCIIGTGPAGIILALEYQKLQPHHQILLIEYGTDGAPPRNPLDDSVKIIATQNHHLPYECTNKGLGGSSASWGGRCVMYDEIDFKPRSILDGQCTWTTTLLHETRRYADRAAEYFHCGDGKFNLAEIPGLAGSRIAEYFQNGDVTDSVIERWSLPTRFAKSYRSQIESSPALNLLTGWEACTFGTRPEDGSVSEVELRDFSRTRRIKITARKTVIAAGAGKPRGCC